MWIIISLSDLYFSKLLQRKWSMVMLSLHRSRLKREPEQPWDYIIPKHLGELLSIKPKVTNLSVCLGHSEF